MYSFQPDLEIFFEYSETFFRSIGSEHPGDCECVCVYMLLFALKKEKKNIKRFYWG